MNIAASSDMTVIGEPLNISCTVTYTEGLVVIPTVTLFYTSGSTIEQFETSNISSMVEQVLTITLILNPLSFEQRGSYFCLAEYNVTLYTFDTDSVMKGYTLFLPCKYIYQYRTNLEEYRYY